MNTGTQSGLNDSKLLDNLATALCTADSLHTIKGQLTADEQKRLAAFRTKLATYSNATLTRISESLPYMAGAHIFSRLIVDSDASEGFINDFIAVQPVIRELQITQSRSRRYISALPYYEGLTPQNNGDYPEERSSQASAIFRVTAYLGKSGIETYVDNPGDESEMMYYITDEKLRTMITAHEDPKGFARFIIERGLTSSEEINSLIENLDAIEPPLQQGVL